MTLLQLIEALKTTNVNVSVIDADTDDEIICFKSQGIAGVENEVSARTVRRWEIAGATSIKVTLEAAV